MLNMCINSIRCFIENDDIDMMVICDTHAWPLISHLNLKLALVTPPPPELGSWDKLRIMSLADLSKYEKVMYIDSDVLVTGDLHPMFDAIDEPDVLHVAPVEDYEEHKTQWYSVPFLPYSEMELENFKENNVFPFCVGHFGFRPSEKMKKHFEECYELRTKPWSNQEQSVMNRYFNTRLITRPSLKKFIQLHGMFTYFDHEKAEKKLLNHFIGCEVDPTIKITNMKNFFKSRILQGVSFVIHENCPVQNCPSISEINSKQLGWFIIESEMNEDLSDRLSDQCSRVWWVHPDGKKLLIRI